MKVAEYFSIHCAVAFSRCDPTKGGRIRRCSARRVDRADAPSSVDYSWLRKKISRAHFWPAAARPPGSVVAYCGSGLIVGAGGS